MGILQANQSLFGFYVKSDDGSIETINYDKEGLRDPRIRYSVKLFREHSKHFIGKLEVIEKDQKTFALLSNFNDLSKEIMDKPKLQFFNKENGDIVSLEVDELNEIEKLFETYPEVHKTLGVTDRALINNDVYLCLQKVRKIVKYFKENPPEEEEDSKPTPEEQKQIDTETIKDLISEVEPDKTLQDLILNTQTEIELGVVVKKIKAFYTDDYYREKIKLSGQSIKNRLLFIIL